MMIISCSIIATWLQIRTFQLKAIKRKDRIWRPFMHVVTFSLLQKIKKREMTAVAAFRFSYFFLSNRISRISTMTTIAIVAIDIGRKYRSASDAGGGVGSGEAGGASSTYMDVTA